MNYVSTFCDLNWQAENVTIKLSIVLDRVIYQRALTTNRKPLENTDLEDFTLCLHMFSSQEHNFYMVTQWFEIAVFLYILFSKNIF